LLLLLRRLLQAKKLAGGKYAFKTLLVELPSKALWGAEGTAAAVAAAQQATAAQERSSSSITSTSSSGYHAGSTVSGDTAVGEPAAAAAAAGAEAPAPARVYIVGGPKLAGNRSSLQEAVPASSSGSSVHAAMSSQEPAAQALLEQLKQPLVFALQQNLVLYEAEDEMEAEYHTVLELDPAQMTLLDRAMQGGCVVVRGGLHWSKVAGCEVVKFGRKSLRALQEAKSSSSSSKVEQQGQAAAAASGATPASSSSSSSNSGAAGAAEKM
jgi:hypothetical protein